MIKLAICGAGGRMGGAILALALKDKDIRVAALVERRDSPLTGKRLHDIPVGGDVAAALKASDVMIDFTSAESAIQNARAAAEARRALVVGTTGIEDRATFTRTVKPIPVVWSPNMSLSANVLFDAVETLARLLPSYDAEVAEIHHNLKKDAPSGTAQRLAEAAARGRGKADFVYGRHGLVGERKPAEIGVHALRGGDVVGDHTVFFFGRGERIELTHRVTSRDAFAGGALAAAKWVVGRPAGLYDMRDVLGLSKGSRGRGK